jgi:hypothetical protein
VAPGNAVPLAGMDIVRTANPSAPYRAIIDVYHAAFPDFRRVCVINDERRRRMRVCWRLAGEEVRRRSGQDTPRARLSWLRELFAEFSASSSLAGKTPQGDGRRYPLMFDILTHPVLFVDLIEGMRSRS